MSRAYRPAVAAPFVAAAIATAAALASAATDPGISVSAWLVGLWLIQLVPTVALACALFPDVVKPGKLFPPEPRGPGRLWWNAEISWTVPVTVQRTAAEWGAVL